jgi:hypothetical protein
MSYFDFDYKMRAVNGDLNYIAQKKKDEKTKKKRQRKTKRTNRRNFKRLEFLKDVFYKDVSYSFNHGKKYVKQTYDCRNIEVFNMLEDFIETELRTRVLLHNTVDRSEVSFMPGTDFTVLTLWIAFKEEL